MNFSKSVQQLRHICTCRCTEIQALHVDTINKWIRVCTCVYKNICSINKCVYLYTINKCVRRKADNYFVLTHLEVCQCECKKDSKARAMVCR